MALDFHLIKLTFLFDMNKFTAHQFLSAAEINAAVHQVSQNSNPKQVIEDKGLKTLIKQFSDLERLCESMGLGFALEQVKFALHRLAWPRPNLGTIC